MVECLKNIAGVARVARTVYEELFEFNIRKYQGKHCADDNLSSWLAEGESQSLKKKQKKLFYKQKEEEGGNGEEKQSYYCSNDSNINERLGAALGESVEDVEAVKEEEAGDNDDNNDVE